MSLSVVSIDGSEPVTLVEAKAHLRVTDVAEDTLIEGLITTAREYVESVTGRQIVLATLRQTMDDFPPGFILLRPPVVSITTISYVDPDGATQTLDPSLYQLSTSPVAPRVAPAPGEVWPDTEGETLDAVTIDFVAGSAEPSGREKQAVLLLLSHLYESREPVVVGTISSEIPFTLKSMIRNLWPGNYR